jgi:hypothetical protein
MQCEIQELINDVQTKGMGADAGDPNVNAEEILKQANIMQRQLLDLRLDQNKAGSASDDQNALKKYKNSDSCSRLV